jgi:hypothetical protein
MDSSMGIGYKTPPQSPRIQSIHPPRINPYKMEGSFRVSLENNRRKFDYENYENQRRQMKMFEDACNKCVSSNGESIRRFQIFFDIIKNDDNSVEIFSKHSLPPL